MERCQRSLLLVPWEGTLVYGRCQPEWPGGTEMMSWEGSLVMRGASQKWPGGMELMCGGSFVHRCCTAPLLHMHVTPEGRCKRGILPEERCCPAMWRQHAWCLSRRDHCLGLHQIDVHSARRYALYLTRPCSSSNGLGPGKTLLSPGQNLPSHYPESAPVCTIQH